MATSDGNDMVILSAEYPLGDSIKNGKLGNDVITDLRVVVVGL